MTQGKIQIKEDVLEVLRKHPMKEEKAKFSKKERNQNRVPQSRYESTGEAHKEESRGAGLRSDCKGPIKL